MRYLLLLLLLAGCYTEKKAAKQADKAMKEYPKAINEQFRKEFPCVTTKVDTLIEAYVTYRDTIIEIPVKKSDTVTLHDTSFFNNVIVRKIRLPREVVTITKSIKDSAEVWQCQQLLEESTQQKNELIAEIEKRDNKIGGLKKWKLWLTIPYLIFIAFFILARIFRK
jgi:hypothetical protein